MTLLSSIIIYLMFHLNNVYSYMIDDDCGSDTQFVQSAFRLLAGAVTQLNANPINANVDSLFDTLFGRTASQSPNSDVLRRMTALAAISGFNNNDQSTPRIQPGGNGIIDVRFYCTVKRIKKTDQGRYVNKDRNIEYNLHDKMNRFGKCYDVNPPTLAVTMTGFDGQFNEIQICAWFLEKSRGFKTSDLSDLSHQPFVAFLSKLIMPAVVRLVFTPIDAFVPMDKVIVHELTHTDQAYLADHMSTVDLDDNPYEFKAAKGWGQKYRADPIITNDPMKNADSNALFAVGAWIISQTGVAISQDGTFAKPQTNPKAKR